MSHAGRRAPSSEDGRDRLVSNPRPAEAHRLLASSYGPNRIVVPCADSPLDFELWWTEQKSSRIGYSRYGTDVRIVAPPLESWYVICFPTKGRIVVSSGRDAAPLTPSRGAVLRPFDELRFGARSAFRR